MIKRLIFDVDGTLIAGVSFMKAQRMALMDVNKYSEENLEKLNQAIDEYELNYNTYTKKYFLSFLSKKVGTSLDEKFLVSFFENLAKYAVPKKDDKLIKAIETLSKKYELVLLSNFFEESQRKRLEKVGLNKFFQEYYGEKIIKPNKEAFISAIGKNKEAECIMIGDNLKIDILGASNLKINTIWINQNVEKTNIKTKQVKSIIDITEELITEFEKEKILI